MTQIFRSDYRWWQCNALNMKFSFHSPSSRCFNTILTLATFLSGKQTIDCQSKKKKSAIVMIVLFIPNYIFPSIIKSKNQNIYMHSPIRPCHVMNRHCTHTHTLVTEVTIKIDSSLTSRAFYYLYVRRWYAYSSMHLSMLF